MTPIRGRGRCGDSSTGSSRQASSYGAEPDVEDLTILGSDDGSDIERDGRMALRRNAQGKVALHQRMSSVITQSFKRIANPTGFSWKLTLHPVKLQFFDELRRFSWPPSWEDDVYRMWESRACIRYRDYIHDMKALRTASDLGSNHYCSKEMWMGLCDYRDSPEAQRMSEAARMNRMLEPDGLGSGISKHRGESKSAEILAQEMVRL
ncbi:hypothetical protein OROGR_007556 [Orobanche gracilis]